MRHHPKEKASDKPPEAEREPEVRTSVVAVKLHPQNRKVLLSNDLREPLEPRSKRVRDAVLALSV
jgi:hypothetical protein